MTKITISVNDRDYYVEDDVLVRDILEACDAIPIEEYMLEHSVYLKNDNHICLWQWQWQSIIDHPVSPIPNDSIFRSTYKGRG